MATEYSYSNNIKFVKEVEKYVYLYDSRHRDYMKRDPTERAWEEIGKKFKLTGPECKEKWKNLRSVFVRHLKPVKRSGKAHRKPYYLAKYMKFALPFIKIPNSERLEIENSILNDTNDDCEEEVYEHIIDSESSPSTLQLDSDNSSLLQSQFTLIPKPVHTLQSQPSSSSSIAYQSIAPTPEILPLTMEQNYYEETKEEQDVLDYCMNESPNNTESTCNKMFLLSLLSDMNKMNDKQRRVFKQNVLQLVNEIFDKSNKVFGGPYTFLSLSSLTIFSLPSPTNVSPPLPTNVYPPLPTIVSPPSPTEVFPSSSTDVFFFLVYACESYIESDL